MTDVILESTFAVLGLGALIYMIVRLKAGKRIFHVYPGFMLLQAADFVLNLVSHRLLIAAVHAFVFISFGVLALLKFNRSDA